YLNTVTHTSTLSNLTPGNYVLTATTVAANNPNYSPSPTSETVTVANDATPVPTSVVYSTSVVTLDLSIGEMYLTQSTQTPSNSVPLVQNRDGYLRVFVVANQANTATPQVRVRFPVSGTPLALKVNNISPFYLRFVPVKQSLNSLTGSVTSANKDALLVKTMKIHPIAGYSADVHALYTTNAPVVTGSNANGAWQ